MAEGIRAVAALADPVGETLAPWTRPNGLDIPKVRVPIGVVGIIYESRPNVTSDAAVLCTKTGNATILRGGSESIHSNVAIAAALRAGRPRPACRRTASCSSRDRPRGGAAPRRDGPIPRCDRAARRQGADRDRGQHARMPVIKHYHGVCILYVDEAADLEMAEKIVVNAKCQRPGVCNAVETVLVHRDGGGRVLAAHGGGAREHGVEIRGDAEAAGAPGGRPATVVPATEED